VSLFRTIAVLLGGVALMLGVVIVRAETTRLHYETSQRELKFEQLRHQLREAEMRLACLRDPMRIRERVPEVVRQLIEENAAPESPNPRRGGRR